MKSEIGDKNFQIWLLGDSNPKNWQEILVTPLDPRHPARHSIWTPVLDVIQDSVFRNARKRVDTSSVYIRNAIENPFDKPTENQNNWNENVEQANRELSQLISQYHPVFVFCFGAFSFEFIRRALNENPKRPFGYWGAKRLGIEFRQRIQKFDPSKINILPLLHTSISRGRFFESHNYFTDQVGGNYFEFVGNHIADKLLKYDQDLKIWIV